MKRLLFVVCACIGIISTCNLLAGSASFEVWSDNGNLTKLSSNTTDSVTFSLQGNVATIRCEIREQYDGKPTRRLQLTLANFSGVKTYDVNTTTTFWENFSATKKCECTNSISNNFVTITEYDSVKKNIKGTFEFKCLSTSSGGGELKYRIRAGSFDAGQPKLKLDVLPKDTVALSIVTIGKPDTTIGIRIKVLDPSGNLQEGANIFINDKFATKSNVFSLANTTSSAGVFVYTTTIDALTPTGEYTIKMYAEKTDTKRSDTVTVLYRYGKRYYDYICGGVTILSFDAGVGKEWKKETASPVITANGPVTIGQVLKADGVTRIDTTPGAVKISISGRLYLPQVHYKDGRVEDFVLPVQDFPLPDCNGLMKLATEKATQEKLPGGVEISLKEFSIINRADAVGLSMKAAIKMANARKGCETNGAPDSSKLEVGVSITSAGWEGFSVLANDISLMPALCLKEFNATADFVNESYYMGGKVKFPMKGKDITLGGGALFKNNLSNPDGLIHLDSLQASISLADKDCKPCPETPFCFKSLALSTSGLSAATWQGAILRGTLVMESDEQIILGDARFKWLNDLLGNPAIAELEGTLQYQHPLIFTGIVTSRVAKIGAIAADRPWQIEGSHNATIDFNSKISFSGLYKMGHLGLDDYFLKATGVLTLSWLPTLGITANVTGAARIPAPSPKVLAKNPFLGTTLRFLQLSGFMPLDLGNSTALISQNEVDGFKAEAIVDVSRNPIDYIRSFGRMSVNLAYNNGLSFSTSSSSVPPSSALMVQDGIQSAGSTTDLITAVPSDTISIDDTIERLFVMISSQSKAPVSKLIDPSGKEYTTADTINGVRRFSTPNGEMVQWTLIAPKSGKWILNLTNPIASDSVEITANRKSVPLAIGATQNGPTVTVNWTNRTLGKSDVVKFFLDTDSAGFDGIYVGSTNSNDGNFIYTIPISFTECKYYLYAVRLAKGYVTEMSYAAKSIQGNGSTVSAPVNVTAVSDTKGKTEVRWTRPLNPDITGYAVVVVDENGRDSLYALVFSSEEVATLQINQHQNKKIYVYAFNGNGVRSCKTEAMGIVTSIDHVSDNRQPSIEEPVVIVPHPVSSSATIRFNGHGEQNTSVQILDLNGSLVVQLNALPISRTVSEVTWNTQLLSEGMYIVRIQTSTVMVVSKAVVVR